MLFKESKIYYDGETMNVSKQEKCVNFYTNMIYFLVMVCLVVMRICGHYNLFSFLGRQASFYVSLFTQIGLILLLPLALLKIFTKSRTGDVVKFCCYKKVSYKVILASFALGMIVFFLNVYVSNFFNSIISLFGYKHVSSGGGNATWWGLILSIIGTAILPAYCEETLHRGMLLNGNSMVGMMKSIVISGVLFGLLHLNIEQFFYATIIGLFLGYICWGCCSIWPCIIVHFMNNFLSVLLSFAAKKGWAIGNFFDSLADYVMSNKILGIALFILLLALLVFVAFELVKFMLRETFKYNFVGKQQELANMAIKETYLQSVEDLKNDKMVDENISPIELSAKIIDEKEFMSFVNDNLEEIIKNSVSQMEKEDKFKMDTKSKIFMWGTIALGAIVTFMTFIWGIL